VGPWCVAEGGRFLVVAFILNVSGCRRICANEHVLLLCGAY